MTAVLPTGSLVGRVVRLDLLTEADLPELAPILMDERLYADGYVMHGRPSSTADAIELAARWLSGQGAADGRGGGRNAYAVRLVGDSSLSAAGKLVGTTTLLEADLTHESIHLGATFYDPDVWGTAVNPECKYLLLWACFEEWGYGRVKIQTDVVNTHSAGAIAKLGAQREGVLRRSMRRDDGTFRDTVVFSIIDTDWPDVRTRLEQRLAV